MKKSWLGSGWGEVGSPGTVERMIVGHIVVDYTNIHTEYGETIFDTETARHLKDDFKEEEY